MNKICLHSEETTFITFNHESLKVATHYSLYCGTFKSGALQWKERAEKARERCVTCCKPISRKGRPSSEPGSTPTWTKMPTYKLINNSSKPESAAWARHRG